MQVNNPLISILLPAYNVGNYIGEAIESILNQTFKDFELLIADDGSNDNTYSIIQDFGQQDPRVKIFSNNKNIGKTATVEKLFSASKGRFITIHDGDDVSHPLRFEKQIQAFHNDQELVMCGTSFITVDKGGFLMEMNTMPSSYRDIYEDILIKSQFHGPTMMMKRAVLEELGAIYRPYFSDNYEDTDLAARIIDKGKGYNLREALYVYRILGNSLCRKKVDVRNRTLYKVVAMLSQQRREMAVDYLMQEKPQLADAYLDSVNKEYADDPSLIYHEAAEYFYYWKLYKQALVSAAKALAIRPYYLRNIGTFLYILRKKNFHSIEANKRHYTEVLS